MFGAFRSPCFGKLQEITISSLGFRVEDLEGLGRLGFRGLRFLGLGCI